MAVKDMVTQSVMMLAHQSAIAADTTTLSAIIDTADYDLGVSFYMSAPVYSAGTFKLTFLESDDSGMSGAISVIDDKIIPIFDPAQDAVVTGLVAITADGDLLQKAGLHSTKRYVQAQIVSTDSANATINLMVNLGAELIPA